MSANLIGIGGIEAAEGKRGHVAQQRDETVDLVFGGFFALFGRGLASVADGAFGVEVLRDPAEGMLAGRPEMGALLLHRDGGRDKVLRLINTHEIGANRQHQRGLDVAGMEGVTSDYRSAT